ncbi:unnamed protein product [Didymodactylos carnosus]|uniref:Uncharacterized protein n=1 Tax=Didymodactylos carnosus TaxID=1234261 RepID=A0A8S2DQ79_9BILA|nr:unnamed protein product [Didymodactylos carnosus]CAF3741886.1 unnamed protein product [Didymodactylos carnosus]
MAGTDSKSVRSGFEIDRNTMNEQWPALREVCLQKRRNIKGKISRQTIAAANNITPTQQRRNLATTTALTL